MKIVQHRKSTNMKTVQHEKGTRPETYNIKIVQHELRIVAE